MSDREKDGPAARRPAETMHALPVQAGARVDAHTAAALRQTEAALQQQSQALAESLAIMQATLEAVTDAVLVTGSAGRVTAYNDRFVRLWDLPRPTLEVLEHRVLVDAMARHVRNGAGFASRIEEIEGAPDANMYDRLELDDGRVVERFSQVQTVGGRAAGRVWIFRDVTERESAERARREETRALELLNQAGRAINSTLDLQELLQVVTDAATELSGARFGAFFYNTVNSQGESYLLVTLSGAEREAFGRFGHPRATPLFGPTFRGEKPIRSDDVRLDPRYGQWEPHRGMPTGHPEVRSYLAVPVISRAGEVIGGLFFGHSLPGVFNDRIERLIVGVAAQAAVAVDNARLYDQVRRTADERERLFVAERAARAEADRVGRMKDEFLATLSHELRTPLGAILGWSHVLLMGKSSPEDARRAVETIVRNANAQAQLINDLLDMSRIIAGKIRIERAAVDVGSVVRAAVDAVRPSAEAKAIRLQTALDVAAPVCGDAGRLQQVVWNLLTNAIKFTPQGGSVEVRLDLCDNRLAITVADTGVGIEPEFLPHVFDRFRQADSSLTRSHGGLGLGLAIVQQLVELHGGAVRVQSPGRDQGATFVVALPLDGAPAASADLDAADAAQDALALDAESLRGTRVLVVDDEPDWRELIRKVLSRCGAEVLSAARADEALALLETQPVDLIISDIGMPQKDGYQFIRELRTRLEKHGGRTPAIALTAFARSEDRNDALEAGYQVHAAKPLAIPELIATVASLTRHGAAGGSRQAQAPAG